MNAHHVLRALLRVATACAPLASAPACLAATLHVAPNGDDRSPGTAAAPLRTLATARDKARAFTGREPVTVRVADGIYYLDDSLRFGREDAGSAEAPVVFRAANEGKAVISGGIRLDLSWQAYKDGIVCAETPPGLVIDQLFINGARLPMARYPNADPAKTTAAYQGYAADAFSKERAARWQNPAGGFIHAMHASRWGGYHYRITGKDAEGNVTYQGGWQNNRRMGMHPEFRMVENVFEELDAPGEWFHDAAGHRLYFLPVAGTDLAAAEVEAVRLRHLIECADTGHLTFQGFVFRHTARTFMDTREPLLRSDWAIYRGGAMVVTRCEHITVRDCEFDQPGGNALFFSNFNRHHRVIGCHLHDCGASGICFVGDPAAVRDPLFEYSESQDLAKIDRTPGPKGDNYPADCVVDDCLIHGIGRVERQPAAVQISMSAAITLRDLTIHDCARSGINISEGTWGGHLIEGCDVFDTVLETHDHGSFNSWGRDRYWDKNHRAVSEPAVKADPKLPFLDAMKPTVIRLSRWRCDHGWDIDLDDGSSNYQIHDNLLLAGGLKFREGYRRHASNNVIVGNGFHPHVWFEGSDSVFEHNIVMRAHAPIGQPEGWGSGVNHNFFTREADLDKARQQGADPDSLAGDPMFVNPEAGDFRVRDGSPALKTGFRNFPMDRFGVKKPALKAIAKTPMIPSLTSAPQSVAGPWRAVWLGAPLHALQGEEFSAFGVTREDGGVQLVKVPEGSAAASAGLQTNDLVMALNGQPTPNTETLFVALLENADKPVELRLVRAQQLRTMRLAAIPHLIREQAADPEGFQVLKPGGRQQLRFTAVTATANEALAILGDGVLARNYGPVFPNGCADGAYLIDLGEVRTITSLTSWSYNQNGNRGRQRITYYGSRASAGPGYNPDRYRPIGSLDSGPAAAAFTAVALQAPVAGELGRYRFLLVQVAPVTAQQENTAFQEFAVGTAE